MKARAANVAVAVVALVVVTAAVVDVARHHAGNRGVARVAARTLEIAGRAHIASALRARGARGTLYVVDRGCKLHALVLPALREVAAPRSGGCDALVSPSTPPPGWSVWPPTARLAAWCDGRRVLVGASTGTALPLIGGCAPAWRPDGSITYIRRGAIVQFPRTGRAQDLLSAPQVTAALGRGWRAERIAWLGTDRLALVASRGPNFVLALFSGKDVAARIRVLPGTDLRASLRGTFVGARSTDGVQVYDARVGLRRVSASAKQTAVAWSPDERWVAVATKRDVVLRHGGERVVLPLSAVDLAWTR